ncbi:type II and III secretion system protein family protein [Litorimonas sp. WD9-15]|uniref:type II and III secretion system protein family protein n=1 Tax=Litorimonas sp. WD9-15 TaxID=3418716 RepID=UPI003D06A3FF
MMMKQTFRTSATALALVGALGLLAAPSQAGTRSYSNVQNATAAVKIQGPGTSAKNQSIILPLSKSTVIELPENVMDVIVSDPNVVDAVIHTSRRTMLIGKNAGQTNAYFYSHDGRELLNLDIRVERDIGGLEGLIAQNAPDSDVEVQVFNSNILLTGMVPNAAAADRVEKLARMWLTTGGPQSAEGEIVNLMSIAGKDQVMLKVRIVEMQRSVTKQMGLNLNAIGELGDGTVSLINQVGPSFSGGLNASGNFNNTGSGDLTSLGGALNALETVGLVRTLAEPTLTAISGETANFLAGGEIPLFAGSFRDEDGNLQRSFEFKPFGVSLGFTPVVLSEGLISLSISTEVSEPTTENSFLADGGDNVLGIRVRRANTVVELPAGGSLVIAGLIREEARSTVDGTPGLKDVPGLGALFRGRDSQSTQTELVVIVTPYLVDATHPDKLQTPTDGFQAPNDVESLMLGRLNKIYAENGKPEIQSSSLGGPFGHVVD